MNSLEHLPGVWFVYDGDCPLCQHAAYATRIKQKYGQLHLIDARSQNQDHPLLKEIQHRCLDLDEGMVIFHNAKFYHGKSALNFMALHADKKGFLQYISLFLFRSETISNILYPVLRGIRNCLLKIRGVNQIKNLETSCAPIFQPIFAQNWNQLPLSLQRHYINRPYSTDKTTIKGKMSIDYHWIVNLIRPFYRILGSIPIQKAQDLPVTVIFSSNKNSRAFHFHRIFYFADAKYSFRSKMLQQKDNQVVEIMRFGFCWKITYLFNDNIVTLQHRGYALTLFNFYLPLPITWLIGRGDAQEIAIDDNSFSMRVIINHPLFGDIYNYSGTFTFVELPN